MDVRVRIMAFVLCFWCCFASAQRIGQTALAAEPRVAVHGSVVSQAGGAVDLGLLADATPVQGITLRFSLTKAQNAALTRLLEDQQSPASPRYRQWLKPEQYGAQFGLSDADLSRVGEYLAAQGLKITSVARGKSFMTVGGSTAAVSRALGASLHAVSLGGERHFANLSEPQLPASLAAVIGSVTGLNDFRLKPRVRVAYTSSTSGAHYLAPGDLYTLYDINPLLASGVNGAGVTIAVMGQTDISLASVAAFRTASGLAANVPVVKLYGTDPGTSSADVPEAMLDVEWAGAIAPGATILYVNATDVIAGSLTQAIDNNVAPILTMSYGDCEQHFGAGDLAMYQQLFRQANAQGQTIVGPAGDSGATDCDYNVAVATQGLAVDFPASSPNVTGLGGTMLNEGAGTYFAPANGAFAGSALSYIPEAVWNETAGYGQLAGGGGGVSAYFTKPAYQTGLGVPNDFSRDVPDLSLASAVVHDGYLICTPGYCTNGFRNAAGNLNVIGGTSVATPEFAGMLALLEQKIQARLGNANPVLYGLANSSYATAVFHDVTTGNNAMPCAAGSAGCPAGGSLGYSAATGYDLATGWGSVDAYNLISDWLLAVPAGGTGSVGVAFSMTTLTSSAASVTVGTSLTLTAAVISSSSGSTSTPTGTVQFLVDNVATGSGIAVSGGVATYSLSTAGLAPGSHVVSASYSGDATFAGSKAALSIGVLPSTVADFSLTPGTVTVTTTSGGTAPGVTFSVAPVNGFSGTVSFQVTTTSTTLSTTLTPSFNPAQVLISGAASGSTVLTLSASRTASAMMLPAGARYCAVIFTAFFCLSIPLVRRRRWAGLLVVPLALVALSGCSSGGANTSASLPVNTPAGTYTVLVTATGTSSTGAVTSHNATLTFVVQ